MSEVSEAQFLAFGKIMHGYAGLEWGIKCLLAGVLNIPFVEAFIVAEPCSASALQNVVKSATKLSKLSEKDQQEIIQIVGEWGSFAKLRNAIAHRRWEKGTREGSIRPVGVDIRSGKAKMIGDVEDRDWVEGELSKEAGKLDALNERAIAFYYQSGLADAVEAKNKEMMSD